MLSTHSVCLKKIYRLTANVAHYLNNLIDFFIQSIIIVYNTFIGMSDGYVFEKVREYSWIRGIFVMTN